MVGDSRGTAIKKTIRESLLPTCSAKNMVQLNKGGNLSNQVPGSMGSRNGNVVRGTLLKLGFNTTGTRLFPRSRNGTNVPRTRNVAKFPVPGY
jgi:hypothetical protein